MTLRGSREGKKKPPDKSQLLAESHPHGAVQTPQLPSPPCPSALPAPRDIPSAYPGLPWQKVAQMLSLECEHSHLPADLLRRLGGLPKP